MERAEYLKINQLLLWKVSLFFLDTDWEGGSGMDSPRNLSLSVNQSSFSTSFLVNSQRLLCCLKSCCDLSGARGVNSGAYGPSLAGSESKEICSFPGHVNTQHPIYQETELQGGSYPTSESIPP